MYTVVSIEFRKWDGNIMGNGSGILKRMLKEVKSLQTEIRTIRSYSTAMSRCRSQGASNQNDICLLILICRRFVVAFFLLFFVSEISGEIELVTEISGEIQIDGEVWIKNAKILGVTVCTVMLSHPSVPIMWMSFDGRSVVQRIGRTDPSVLKKPSECTFKGHPPTVICEYIPLSPSSFTLSLL